jgi:predicted nucleic acid-binding protein
VEFGTIKAALEHTGVMIDDSDIAVAAIAITHGARVVTANLSHFSRIDRLDSLHWDAVEA